MSAMEKNMVLVFFWQCQYFELFAACHPRASRLTARRLSTTVDGALCFMFTAPAAKGQLRTGSGTNEHNTKGERASLKMEPAVSMKPKGAAICFTSAIANNFIDYGCKQAGMWQSSRFDNENRMNFYGYPVTQRSWLLCSSFSKFMREKH